MTVRPIIFSAPMVRALLEGRKTQTRRLFRRTKEPPPSWDGSFGFSCLCPQGFVELRGWTAELGPISRFMRLRFWNDDLLWVRENWKPHSLYAGRPPRDVPHSHVFFRADDGYAPSNTPWIPSIFMPRWASRITLQVRSLKVERLQSISEADAQREGCRGVRGPDRNFPDEWDPSPQEEFRDLWKSLHGAESWDANPEVIALTFTVHKQNVDDFLRQREAA